MRKPGQRVMLSLPELDQPYLNYPLHAHVVMFARLEMVLLFLDELYYASTERFSLTYAHLLDDVPVCLVRSLLHRLQCDFV